MGVSDEGISGGKVSSGHSGKAAPFRYVWVILTKRISSCPNGSCVRALKLPQQVPQPGSLAATEIYCLTVLEGKSSNHWVGSAVLPLMVPGKNLSLSLRAFDVC